MPFKIKGSASSGHGEADSEYSSEEGEDDPDSTVIIHTESFSFFFQRDSPATLTAEHAHLRSDHEEESSDNLADLLPKQQLDVVVHNECVVNYGPYADDLRAKLMANFLPFMYQHREATPLIPTEIGDSFHFQSLDICIRFDEPRGNIVAESYSDTTSSAASSGNGKHQRLKPGHFSSSHPNGNSAKYNVPWFILNIPFSANIDDEAKRLNEDEQHRDNVE